MPVQLTDDVVKNLAPPAKGYAITYDTKVKGFGCRVTAAGAKAFVLNYVTRDGRERRYTIGPAPGWKVKAARREAEDIKAGLRRGEDPLDALENERAARREEAAQPTVNTLCDRFEVDYLPTLRPASQRDYRSLLKEIRADLGALKVRDVSHDDVKGLHARLTKRAPWRANRAVAVTSKLFTYASKTPAVSRQPDDKVAPPVMRPDGVNPAKGIQLNPEAKRRRYLNKKEREAVMAALDKLEDKQGADAIRLLLLTGARKGELLAARWNDFDLEAGKWTKPGATTKQKTEHVVQLSPQVITLLKGMKERAEAKKRPLPDDAHLFPGRNKGQPHRTELRNAWIDVCTEAGLMKQFDTGKTTAKGDPVTVPRPTARLHDLRHTFASLLVSEGESLPVIGAMLGHTQPSTTNRYAHLFDDPLQRAAAKVADLLMPTPMGDEGQGAANAA